MGIFGNSEFEFSSNGKFHISVNCADYFLRAVSCEQVTLAGLQTCLIKEIEPSFDCNCVRVEQGNWLLLTTFLKKL